MTDPTPTGATTAVHAGGLATQTVAALSPSTNSAAALAGISSLGKQTVIADVADHFLATHAYTSSMLDSVGTQMNTWNDSLVKAAGANLAAFDHISKLAASPALTSALKATESIANTIGKQAVTAAAAKPFWATHAYTSPMHDIIGTQMNTWNDSLVKAAGANLAAFDHISKLAASPALTSALKATESIANTIAASPALAGLARQMVSADAVLARLADLDLSINSSAISTLHEQALSWPDGTFGPVGNAESTPSTATLESSAGSDSPFETGCRSALLELLRPACLLVPSKEQVGQFLGRSADTAGALGLVASGFGSPEFALDVAQEIIGLSFMITLLWMLVPEWRERR